MEPVIFFRPRKPQPMVMGGECGAAQNGYVHITLCIGGKAIRESQSNEHTSKSVCSVHEGESGEENFFSPEASAQRIGGLDRKI